jgi:hypothetical protein
MTDEKKRATRPVGNVRVMRDGSIVAESTLSPESFVVGAEVWIPPRKVTPIVFVPGIMGSNLKVKEDKQSADTVRRRMGVGSSDPIPNPWSPPNGISEGLSEVKQWKGRTPRTRQALLSGDTTTVDDMGFLKISLDGMSLSNVTSNNTEEARFRGWGTVHWDSYGAFLLYLEGELRGLQDPGLEQKCAEWHTLLHAGDPKKSKAPAQLKVQEDDLKKMSKYWFPVYACGYNWINSNAESGQHLLDTIEKIVEVYTSFKGPSGKQLFQCEKVILVTHSMGGLVGRWAAKQDGGKRILGVIHGVQPATGAPLAYRRTAGGTEMNSPTNSWVGNEIADNFATILGRNAAETTPVTANSPGALQLLPTKHYPKGWLQVERQGSGNQTEKLFSLPEKDPYAEIYREKNAWWGLVNPGLLDPAGRYKGGKQDPWVDGFLTCLNEAESFHDKLGDFYLENKTYVFYGDDPKHASFGTVRWQLGADSSHLSAAEIQKADRIDPLGRDAGMTDLKVDRRLDHPETLPDGKKKVGTRWISQAALQPQDAPGDVVCFLSRPPCDFSFIQHAFSCAGQGEPGAGRVKDAKAEPGLRLGRAGSLACGRPVTAFALPRCFDPPLPSLEAPAVQEKGWSSQAAVGVLGAW